MCPLNISDGRPPAPAHVPTVFARPSSTCCHWACRPSRAVELDHQLRHRLLAAGEAPDVDHPPRRLDETIAVDGDGRERHAHASRKCGSTFSPKRRICSSRSAPQSSSMMWVQPASRYSSIASMQSLGRSRDGLALVEQRVGHLRLRGEAAALLHRLGDGADLVLVDLGQVEEDVGGALDVLHLVGEVHAADLAGAVAAGVAVGRVDRGEDRAAQVDVLRGAARLGGALADVPGGVADEGGRRDRGRQEPVADLAAELLHQRRGAGDVDGHRPARRVRLVGERGDVGREDLAVVLEPLAAEDPAHDLDRVAHVRERLRHLRRAALLRVVEEDLRGPEAEDEAALAGGLLHDPRVHRHLHGVARVGRDDPPADREPRRLAGHQRRDDGRAARLHLVLAPPRVGLREPDGVDPRLVHRARGGEHLVERLHRQLHDADAERNRHLSLPRSRR